MSKNYLAYTLLVFATFCWSGNFIVGKYAYLYEVPPLTLNFFRWISVWLILIPFTYKEIFNNWNYIKKNLIVISFMGIMTISTFNSVVYFALNYTQVINVALVLAAIPAVTIIVSSFMKVDRTNVFQLIGLLLSVIGISSIISNADIIKILSLNFNIPFFIILFYVVMFPALAAYYCWQKGVEIVGPNRATMFIQLMPLLSAVLAIMIFQETFELYHFIGASFILSGIYLSNKKTTK